MERKTYGQEILDHRAQNHTLDDDVIEYRREMESDIMAKVRITAEDAAMQSPYDKLDAFYVVLLFKVEHIGQAVRSLTLARQSCPTPVYKQSVWKYHKFGNQLEFMWTIPDKILYWHIYKNPGKYLQDKETAQLAQFVLLMESGELLQWVKKENNEKKDAVIKITQGES